MRKNFVIIKIKEAGKHIYNAYLQARKTTSAMRKIARIVAPTAIPAIAPEDRPADCPNYNTQNFPAKRYDIIPCIYGPRYSRIWRESSSRDRRGGCRWGTECISSRCRCRWWCRRTLLANNKGRCSNSKSHNCLIDQYILKRNEEMAMKIDVVCALCQTVAMPQCNKDERATEAHTTEHHKIKTVPEWHGHH